MVAPSKQIKEGRVTDHNDFFAELEAEDEGGIVSADKVD